MGIWLLITLFIYTIIGEYIQWHLQLSLVRKEIKHQLKSQIPKSQLHRFILNKNSFQQLNWIKKNKEFKLNENLYDVVNCTSNNEFTTLLCINDKEESVLFKNLDEMVGNALQTKSTKDKGLKTPKRWLMTLDFESFEQFPFFITVKYTFSNLVVFYKNHIGKVHYPPPELIELA